MRILSNEPLKRHITMRVGGTADTMLIPESEEEFVRAYSETLDRDLPVFILGRGSNTLFKDVGFCGVVIKTTKACSDIRIKKIVRRKFRKKYLVEVGASVPNQSFLRFCMENKLAGPTYLQSVPGNIGGSIFMNAGTGFDEGQSISNKLKEVRIYDGEKIFSLPKESCDFMFRHSVFHDRRWLILRAVFEFETKSSRIVEREIKARMVYAKKWQDLGYPNAGSVFKEGYKDIEGLRGKQFGKAMFSRKSANWIINLGEASAEDVLFLVDWAMELHEQSGYSRPVPEWIIR